MKTSGSCSTLIRNGSSPSLQPASRGSGASSSRGAGGPSSTARDLQGTTQPLAACSSPPTRKSPGTTAPRPFVSTQSQSTLSTSSVMQSDDEAGITTDQSTSTTTLSTTLPRLIVEDADIPVTNCYRLVLLGSARVGKTSLVARFLGDHFKDAYTPTIEDFHRKFYRIRGETYRLDILDTSGNDPFPAMRRLSLMTGALSVNNQLSCR